MAARLASQQAAKDVVVGRCCHLHGSGGDVNTHLGCTGLAVGVLTDTLNHCGALVQFLGDAVVLLGLCRSEITVLCRCVVEKRLGLGPCTTPDFLLALNESVHVDSIRVVVVGWAVPWLGRWRSRG